MSETLTEMEHRFVSLCPFRAVVDNCPFVASTSCPHEQSTPWLFGALGAVAEVEGGRTGRKAGWCVLTLCTVRVRCEWLETEYLGT